MIKNAKGITLIALVMTIAILLILSSATIYSITSAPNTEEFSKMRNDIEALRDKVLMYYNKYTTIPNMPTQITNVPTKIKGNDKNEGVYYEINIYQLGSLTLNYGNKKDGDNKDIYIINSKNLNIYYLKGVEYLGEICYTI